MARAKSGLAKSPDNSVRRARRPSGAVDTVDARNILKMLQVFIREAIGNEDPKAVQALLHEMQALAHDAHHHVAQKELSKVPGNETQPIP